MVLANSSTVTSAARVDAMVSSDCSIVRRMLEVACSMGWIVSLLKSSIITECVDGYWDEGVNCSSRERGSPLVKSSPRCGPRQECGVPGNGPTEEPRPPALGSIRHLIILQSVPNSHHSRNAGLRPRFSAYALAPLETRSAAR